MPHLKPGDRVLRIATGEPGVVLEVQGDFVRAAFATSGEASFLVSDLEPAPADPISKLRFRDFAPHPEYGLRLQARYLQHAYKYDPQSGLSNARVEPQLHQVFVAHRVSNKLRPRMILADEVGLGKTIEAGLIMKEQIARGLADRILVVCPASLQYQWVYELESKFNEEFTILDGPTVKMLGRDGTNPWSKVERVVTSLQFARREDTAAQIVDASWDMVVFDEAHHVRRRREGRNKVTATQAYRLADELKDQVDGLLLLTATPMQIDPFELYSLIELVEPGLYPSFESYEQRRKTLPALNSLMRDLQSWDALTAPDRAQARQQHHRVLLTLGSASGSPELDDPGAREKLMNELVEKHPLSQTLVRNRKGVVGGFTRRRAHRLPVQLTPDEARIHQEVTDYILEGYNRAIREQQNAVGFLMVLYQKMLASSSNALRVSFQKRLAALRSALEEADAFAHGDLTEDDLVALVGEEELSDAIEALEGLAANREAAAWEISMLEHLVGELGQIRDSKADTLLRKLVEPTLRAAPEEKILVFTRFIETQKLLHLTLEAAGYRVVSFNGQMSLEEKERAVGTFRTAAQIMVTTEAGGEGRNFQFAHIMVNYDLPWNPMVVEQRIGRLDRIGQTKEVLIYNLAAEGTVEDRVLEVLDERIGLFEESVGSLDPILGEVERDIERLVMENAATLSVEIESFGKELEQRVQEARVRERVLADFILDRASLRKDEAAELLGGEALARWSDLRDFVGSVLDYFGGRLSEHAEGGYNLALSPKLSQRLRIKDTVTRGEFDPIAALRMEELPFLAFGQEVIDAVVTHTAEREVASGARFVPGAPADWSVEIVYELESEGVSPSGRMIRHLVGGDLGLREERLTHVPDVGTEVDLPPDIDWIEGAIAASEAKIRDAHAEARRDAARENEEIRRAALDRAERVYEHERGRLHQLIADEEAWIHRAEGGGTEGERRVLPARRGRLERNRQRLASLNETYAQQRDDIEQKRADVRLRVVAAGLVKGV